MWQVLLTEIFRSVSENYDVPANLTTKHLRLFLPAPDNSEQALGVPSEYKEIVFFKVQSSRLQMKVDNSHLKQKLDFSSAVGSFSSGSPRAWPPIICDKTLFVCFIDPDNDSPSSGSQSD